MPTYECPRCGYRSKIKTHMQKHFKRKNPCRSVNNNTSISDCINALIDNNMGKIHKNPSFSLKNPSKITQKPLKNPSISLNFPQNHTKSLNFPQKLLICEFCSKKFTRKDNLTRHTSVCKKKTIEYNVSCDNLPNSKDFFSKKEVEEIIRRTKNEYDLKVVENMTIIDELRKQVELLIRNQGSNNITFNTNIVLNAFGKENTSYITSDYVKLLINNGPIQSIPKLLEHIHFNPEHVENHNIQIPNKKEPYAKIFNGTKWEISDRKRAIRDMTDKAYDILTKHYNGGNEYMNKFQNQYDDANKVLNKRINKDTEIMIINNQSIL
jgi:hypothetical protein